MDTKYFIVKLDTLDKVKAFVHAVSTLSFNVLLACYPYIVDAKSIMGIFSLDLSKPLMVYPDPSTENFREAAEELAEVIKSYVYHNPKIILLCGESGSGKTTVATTLEKMYNLKQIQSYTTRPPRKKGENGHIFVSDDEFNAIPTESMAAYTLYNGHEYCGTVEQVEHSDIYVIDQDGIEYFKNHYRGNKVPLVIYLKTSLEERIKRMTQRKDSQEDIEKRVKTDNAEFIEAETLADIVIENNNSIETAKEIWRLFTEE